MTSNVAASTSSRGAPSTSSHIALMPTGGVSLKTAEGFIQAGAFALGVGADLVDMDAIRAGQAAPVTERAREYVQIVQAARAGD